MTNRKLSLLLTLIFMGAAAAPSFAAMASDQEGIGSVEERRILADIEERKEQFRKKEEALILRETELTSLSLEIDRKLADLEALRDQIADLFKEKEAAEKERIKTLSQMYEKMDKAKAAKLLGEIDWELSLAIMSEIKTKIRSKIISQMDPQYAIRYTKAYSTLEKD